MGLKHGLITAVIVLAMFYVVNKNYFGIGKLVGQ